MPVNREKIKDRKLDFAAVGLMLLVAALLVHLALVWRFRFTQDDAFITFRYAANYLNGNGLVYNIGERVEGFTNFLWTIFMIIGGKYGLDYVLFSQIMGILFGLGTIIITFLLTREVLKQEPKPWRSSLAGAAALILGATYSFAYWTISGLETSAFVFVFTSAIYCYLRRSFILLPLLVVAALLRPEGVLLFVIIAGFEVFFGKGFGRLMAFTIAAYFIFLIPYAVFKLSYYHSLLPNTFYAKTSFSLQQVMDGLEYAGRFFRHYWGFGLFLLPVIFTIRKWGRREKFLISIIFVYGAYIVLIGGDVLGVHRFFAPLMPLFLIVAVAAGYRMIKMRYILIIFLLALAGWRLYVPHSYVTTFLSNEKNLIIKAVSLMGQLKKADDSKFSLATSTIGMIGYELPGHRVVDLLGLTDTTIARHPEEGVEGMETTWRERHFNSPYILSQQIDYIRFSTGYKPSAPAERALFMYSKFLNNYRTIPFRVFGSAMPVYKRYYSIKEPIERDVDIKFVQYLNSFMNNYSSKRNLQAAAAFLDSAKMYSPAQEYPYLYLYRVLVHEAVGNSEAAKETLETLTEIDTLVAEAYLKIGYYATLDGNQELIKECERRVLQLVPWYFKGPENKNTPPEAGDE